MSRDPLAAVPADQQWFWSERWQEREREVDEHLNEGRVQTYDDVDEFLELLDG